MNSTWLATLPFDSVSLATRTPVARLCYSTYEGRPHGITSRFTTVLVVSCLLVAMRMLEVDRRARRRGRENGWEGQPRSSSEVWTCHKESGGRYKWPRRWSRWETSLIQKVTHKEIMIARLKLLVTALDIHCSGGNEMWEVLHKPYTLCSRNSSWPALQKPPKMIPVLNVGEQKQELHCFTITPLTFLQESRWWNLQCHQSTKLCVLIPESLLKMRIFKMDHLCLCSTTAM